MLAIVDYEGFGFLANVHMQKLYVITQFVPNCVDNETYDADNTQSNFIIAHVLLVCVFNNKPCHTRQKHPTPSITPIPTPTFVPEAVTTQFTMTVDYIVPMICNTKLIGCKRQNLNDQHCPLWGFGGGGGGGYVTKKG